MATSINLKVEPGSPMVYANYAVVQHTPADIIIRFCLVDPMRGGAVSEAGESGELASVDAPAVVSVFLNPEVAEALIGAIVQGVTNWKEQREAGLTNG